MTAVIGGGFAFLEDSNASKFRSLFLPALRKVQRQVHANLGHEDDALMYVEELMYLLLGSLCANQPRTTQDVEDRVGKTFPHPVDQWAVKEARRALDNHKKKQVLVFPADKLHSLLQKEVWGYKVDDKVSLYLTAVLEYMSADILKLAGNYVRNSRRNLITKQDIKVAMNADKVLLDMFEHDQAPIEDEVCCTNVLVCILSVCCYVNCVTSSGVY
jgi:son of sevenless-like protein